jgi:hypothetical protein
MEVSQIYSNRHCNNDQLQIYYRFENTGNIDTLLDHSGNNRHAYHVPGTSSAPWWTRSNDHAVALPPWTVSPPLCANGVCNNVNCLRDQNDGHMEWSAMSYYRYPNTGVNSLSLNNVDFSYCYWFYRVRNYVHDAVFSHGSNAATGTLLHAGTRASGTPTFVSQNVKISIDIEMINNK